MEHNNKNEATAAANAGAAAGNLVLDNIGNITDILTDIGYSVPAAKLLTITAEIHNLLNAFGDKDNVFSRTNTEDGIEGAARDMGNVLGSALVMSRFDAAPLTAYIALKENINENESYIRI